MPELYESDSLFTLSPWGQAGVLAISAMLAVLMLLAMRGLAAWLGWWALALVPVAVWLFEWLSPQVYYFYYLTLFDGLPLQVVIRWPPPGVQHVLEIVSFQGAATLSAHGRGVLVWSMLGYTIWCLLRRQRSRHSR